LKGRISFSILLLEKLDVVVLLLQGISDNFIERNIVSREKYIVHMV